MRHQVFGRKLGRNIDQRRRLFRNQAVSFILNGSLTTTVSKLKALQGLIDKLITTAKVNNLTSKRKLIQKLNNAKAVDKLLLEIGPLFIKTAGGYTRLIKLKHRMGDNAQIAQLTFTKEILIPEKIVKVAKTGTPMTDDKKLKKTKKLAKNAKD